MAYISWIHFIKRLFIHFAFFKCFSEEISMQALRIVQQIGRFATSHQQNVSEMMLVHHDLLM